MSRGRDKAWRAWGEALEEAVRVRAEERAAAMAGPDRVYDETVAKAWRVYQEALEKAREGG